jgi:GntR family transcriptional regulator, rspAB operon transcriptional repressor
MTPFTGDKIPGKVIREIFPRKLHQYRAAEKLYPKLKRMMLSGKLKKGQRLFREEVAQSFGVCENVANKAILELKKEGLIIVKPGSGTYVA